MKLPSISTETECPSNAFSSSVLHMMNVRKKGKDGRPMIHFFSFRPTTRLNLFYLRSHSWHNQRKILNPLTMTDFMDWDFGIMALHSRLEMEIEHFKRKYIEIHNLVHSASLKDNADTLTSRLGPPLPNSCQVIISTFCSVVSFLNFTPHYVSPLVCLPL